MFVDKIKQLQKSKKFKFLIMSILIIIIFFYYKTFFTYGVYFNDTFLEKEVLSDETHYIGKSKYGNIQVKVKGKAIETEESSVEVFFLLPNDINKQYTVYFNNQDEWDIGVVEIKDEKGNTLFEGKYTKNSLFLYDKNREPIIEENIGFYIDTGEAIIYNSDYKISMKRVVEFSLLENETIRGDVELMAYAVFIILITIIDVKYPLLLFTFSNFISVKDPEPTEFYIAMQRVSWIAFPIFAILMLIVAI